MPVFTALYDACVLYPAPLWDFLMWLAQSGLFRARWSNAIHEEWIRSLLAARPDLTREALQRTRHLMNRAVDDCLVEGYESLIPTLSLPDLDDRHVLAAAIHGGASVVVTFNLGDFPTAVLAPHGIETWHPDVLACRLLDVDTAAVLETVRQHRASLKKPPKSVEEYLLTLERQGLAETVRRLRVHSSQL